MRMALQARRGPAPCRRSQSGQVLVFGLFVMFVGVAVLFFVFNTGQLIKEKTKLVNTADAAAYSAGVMTARTLNIAAYTNRAMVANSIAIAQLVSLGSWVDYISKQGSYTTIPTGTERTKSTPGLVDAGFLGPDKYASYNEAFGRAVLAGTLGFYPQIFDPQFIVNYGASSDAMIHFTLWRSQLMFFLNLRKARETVMDDVVQANYDAADAVKIDVRPLADDLGPAATPEEFQDGLGGFVQWYNDKSRQRFLDLLESVQKEDGLTAPQIKWRLDAQTPSRCPGTVDYLDRVRGTAMRVESNTAPGYETVPADQIGYDRWISSDQLVETYFDPDNGCAAAQRILAIGNVSVGNAENFAGLPPFFELSQNALTKEDPRLRFAVRVLRGRTALATSEGTSSIRNTPTLNAYQAQMAGPEDDALVAVGASQAYFVRGSQNSFGEKTGKPNEVGSLFNPFWHASLANAPGEVNAARGLQGVGGL